MNTEQKFWLVVILCITLIIVTVSVVTAFYWTKRNILITDMVKNGTDPVGAICALENDYGQHPTCIVYLYQRDESVDGG
jgi:hypothetical protein